LLGCASVPQHCGLIEVDLDTVAAIVTKSQCGLSHNMPRCGSQLVQLDRPLKILLESRATITVHVSEHDLRLGLPLVHVLLQPAQKLGVRLAGWRSAERAALVVLPALDKACRANALAAALVECFSVTFDWEHV
jgi:hypothetical protein